MELAGKSVKIYLLTPLVSNERNMILKGKIQEKATDGFWIEPEGSKKLIFIPTHKVDFAEVV